MFNFGIIFKCGIINYMTGLMHGRHKKIISHRLDSGGGGGGEISFLAMQKEVIRDRNSI